MTMAHKYNKEKFSELISNNPPSNWTKIHQARKAERSWKKNSTIIALNVLTLLEQKGWSQLRLAQEMGVSATQVSKIVKGQVNFTLESISRLELAIGSKMINIDVIDPEREQRNYAQLIEWLKKSKSLRTVKSSKKIAVANVRVETSFSNTRTVPHKEFNMSIVADNNLRPTG
jgi:transcriptional regulator with XRE-family HTH domain|tara:strand:+ start:714 stop:1232 length:519 start_codon:yes stop_codon:yes gene_type:complete